VEDITGAKLPSDHHALGYFYICILHHKAQQTVRETATQAEHNRRLLEVSIHSSSLLATFMKLEPIFMQWKHLKKNSS